MNREQRRAAARQHQVGSHSGAKSCAPAGDPNGTPASVLDAMTGHRMTGGCDDCDAYQTITQHTPGVYMLNVWHDDDCPELRRHTQ